LNMRRITDLSIESGLEGFLHYILMRLEGVKMRDESCPFDDLYLKDIYNRLQLLTEKDISNGLCCLKQAFIAYLDTGSLTYKPDISLFTNDLEINSEKDIVSSKLGLADGLAGKLVRIVSEQNLSNHEKCIHH